MGSLRVRHDWATSLLLLCIGEGNGNPLQCSCLENPRDRGAWWAAVNGVAQSRTQLKWLSSSRHFIWASLVAQRLQHLPAIWETWVQSLSWEAPLEKEMATHSSILAWRIPWREEPSRLQSTGSQRVGHNWATSLFFQDTWRQGIFLVHCYNLIGSRSTWHITDTSHLLREWVNEGI